MKVEYRDEALSIGTSGRIIAILWKGVPTVDRVHAIGEVSRRAAPKLRDGFAMIVVLEETTTVPDSEPRRLLAELMTELAPGIRAVAYISPGTGFAAAAKRAVITGLSLAARPPYPIKVFQSLGQAEQFVAPLLGTATSTGLEPLVTELRREGPAVPL